MYNYCKNLEFPFIIVTLHKYIFYKYIVNSVIKNKRTYKINNFFLYRVINMNYNLNYSI